jgi:hypothetical protein
MSTTGPSMPYAAYVEYGTSKMKAEPYIDKSLLDAYGKLTELARIEWEKALS